MSSPSNHFIEAAETFIVERVAWQVTWIIDRRPIVWWPCQGARRRMARHPQRQVPAPRLRVQEA